MVGAAVAFRVLRPRCPCRAPAPGVLPGAPAPPAGRAVGAIAPFFLGYRFVFALLDFMCFPIALPGSSLPHEIQHRLPDGCRPFAGAHAARTPLLITLRPSGALPPLTPARGARAGAGCFSWYIPAGCFCCLGVRLRLFFSLRRLLVVCAIFGGVPRFSGGRRLLPLRLSLCFPLRGVGVVVVLGVIIAFSYVDKICLYVDFICIFVDIFVTLQYN